MVSKFISVDRKQGVANRAKIIVKASSHQLLLEKEELEDSCLTRISVPGSAPALSSLLLSSVSDSKQRFSLSELFIRIYSGITQVFQFSIIIGKFSKVPD